MASPMDEFCCLNKDFFKRDSTKDIKIHIGWTYDLQKTLAVMNIAMAIFLFLNTLAGPPLSCNGSDSFPRPDDTCSAQYYFWLPGPAGSLLKTFIG